MLPPIRLPNATTDYVDRFLGRPLNLIRHHPGHARHDLSQPPPRPTLAKLLGRPPPPQCPQPYVDAVTATGVVSVESFLNSSRNTPHAHVDDAPAVQAAMAVAQNCSAAVFFPPGEYSFSTTVAVLGNTELRGSGAFFLSFSPIFNTKLFNHYSTMIMIMMMMKWPRAALVRVPPPTRGCH